MKNYKKIVWVAAGFLLITFSKCKKYEQFPVDQVTTSLIFDKNDSLGTNAYSYLNNIYAILKNGRNDIGGDYLDAASDDAVSSAAASTNEVTILSTAAYNSYSYPADENVWSGTESYWAGIRMANEFVSNIGVVPVQLTFNGVSFKYIWRSEARFLRAYFYFELVKRYGGVPLLGNNVYTITDNVSFPRNNFSDCINYIVSECNAIADTMLTNPIPSPNTYYGRATKGAALALKAKVLLYAASPLFNGGNIDPANPLTGYTNYDATRWTAAAQAAKDVINLGAFSLDQSFKDVFLTQNNPEIIFIRQGDNGNNVETANGPIGFPGANGLGRTSPTQDLVDAFPMSNGLPITDPTSGYDPANPYNNRDPRLTYTVFYNGDQWLNTQLQTYQGGQSEPGNGQQQSLTSYYERKFMGNFETTNSYSAHSEDWVIFRYAEILLDYAEAENEGQPAPGTDVYNAIIQLRQRAGINAGTGGTYGLAPGMSQADMRTVIQNERRIELAFEENRYFDIRRWKIAETVMNQPRRGFLIEQSGTSFTYNTINALTTKFIAPKMYLEPIPYNEVLKNPNMKQNPSW